MKFYVQESSLCIINLFYLCFSYYFDIYSIFCYYEYLVVKIVMSNFHWFFEVDS